MIHSIISKEYHRLSSRIQKIERELKSLPSGKLIYSQTGKYSKWYHRTSRGKSYIPKSNRIFAEQLARKSYLIELRNELIAEQKLLRHYLDRHQPSKATDSFLSSPIFHELLKPYYQPLSQELQTWASDSYPTNPYPFKHSSLVAPSGHIVRSKSELLIAMALFSHKIPFRYECALQLGDETIYPDFTIRHPKTGEFFYYEHFGMANDPKYSTRIGERIQRYISHGIIPGINLIISFETKDHPLDLVALEETLQKYFL